MFYVQCYLLLINAAGLFLMLADKRKAVKGRRRIPEASLMGAAMLGGSFGVLIGMRLFRHKTRKETFAVGVPLLLCFHITIGIAIYIFT